MKRIIIHWTGGTGTFGTLDAEHYHFAIDWTGKVHQGKHKPEANLDCTDGRYAAHTRRCNTGSIGIALCGMHEAVERPFDPGKNPINHKQIDALAELCADLCEGYGIPVTPQTVLTHAEVQPTLGIKQRGKWDITWLPDAKGPMKPVNVGNILRERIAAEMKEPEAPVSGGSVALSGTASLRLPSKKPRTSATQSTTVRASATQIVAGAGTAVTAVSALSGTAQIFALALAGVIVLSGAWIMRERLRHWAQGVR